MTTIARGDIQIDLNDKEAIAGLRAIDSEFDRTMRKIERAHATATIDGDIAPLEDELNNAKRRLRQLQGERAEVSLGVREGSIRKYNAEIKKAKLAVDELDGRKAEVEIKLKGVEKALAQEAALQKADDDRTKAAESAIDRLARKRDAEAAANLRRVNNEARVRASLERQRMREMEQAERLAYRMESERQKAHERATVGVRQEAAEVARLQQQYARLTDRLERITAKRPIGREARAKVELDATSTILQMEALKARLNALGAHPPVDIKADIDKGAARRLTEFLASIGNKAAKLSDLTVRIGPFTTSIKGMITALGFLGPTITDLLGAAGALVGTLGAGLAGAGALAAGALTGAAASGLGLMFSLRNTSAEVKNARKAINAYQKAVQQYGASSDQAKKKQAMMNSTLASISPLAREVATGIERFYSNWDKHTGRTRTNLGRIARDGFHALDQLTPQWARQTNQMSTILANALTRGFQFLGRGPGRQALASITSDFNAALPTLLHGLGAFGHGFLNIAVQGAHNIGILTGGIDSLGQKLLAFTQRDSFGQTIHSWVMQARDLMRFFGALSRVLIHFFGAGSKAGQDMVQNMTNALNRWDRFLTSVRGSSRVAQGFQRAADGATALWHALAPLIGSFVLWANNLSPFVTGVVEGISFVSRLTAKVTELVGLGGPLAALGATMGALWAVGKIGTFVSILARIPGILRDVQAAGSLGGALKALGGLKVGALGATGIEGAGRVAAAEMQAAIAAGGAEAAAEIRAAMITGGAAAAAEEAAGGAVGGAVAGAEVAGGAAAIGAVGAEAGAATAAVGGLTLATGGLILVGAAAAIGLGILASKLGHGKDAVDKLNDALKANRGEMAADSAVINGQANAQDKAARAHREATRSLKELRKELAAAKPGTLEYRDLQLRVYDAEQKRNQTRKDAIGAARQQKQASNSEISDLQKQIDLTKKRTQAEVDRQKRAMYTGGRAAVMSPQAAAENQAKIDQIAAQGASEIARLQTRVTQALNARAAAALNVVRAEHNMSALSGRAAQQTGLLARTNPNLAQTIALKYTSPQNVGQVSQAARRALGQGVTVKTVLKVIADSKDAEAAIRRLRTMEINKKLLRLGITGADGVLSKLSDIDRKAIRKKIAQIIQHGGEPTLAMINRIVQRQIRDKNFRVQAEVGQAISAITAVQALLGAVHNKTVAVNIVQHAISLGNKKASGRPPGGTERALIGEGHGPEHYIDPARGLSFRTNGPMVMDLSPSAYVIPTENAYRNRGRDLLAEAARDLGMNMYAGSRKPKKKKKQFKKLPISHAGSIKTDYFVTHKEETQSAYNRNATAYNNAHKKMGTTADQLRAAERRDHAHHTAATAEAVKKARKAHSEAVKEFNDAKKKNPRLDRERKEALKEYNKYATDQNLIEKYTNDMNAAATKYNATGDSAFLDAWNTAKKARQPIWDEVVKMIQNAQKTAGPKWQSELGKMLSGAQSDSASAEQDQAPEGPAPLTLDDFIQQLGLTDTLTGLNTNLSVAGLTPDMGDDRTAASALVDFYTNLFGQAQGTGNQGLIGEAANALKSARDTLAGVMSPTADESAISNQLQQQLYASQRQNAANEAYIQTALGPGDIGAGTAGGVAAGGGGPNITINTLHPGDPATLRAIGDAATSGMGYQPAVSSTVLRTGM